MFAQIVRSVQSEKTYAETALKCSPEIPKQASKIIGEQPSRSTRVSKTFGKRETGLINT